MNFTLLKIFIVALIAALATSSASIDNCYILAPNSTCQQCSFGHTLQNMTCVKGAIRCKTFAPINGVCTSCYVGYSLDANSSCVVDKNASLLQGCAKPVNNTCLVCSFGYYYNFEGNCQLIDTLCKYFNYASKRCGTCYTGYTYIMSQGKCVKQTYQGDSNCTLWQNFGCLLCDNGYYFDNNGYCVLSNPSCQSFNPANSTQCLSCYPAYTLVNNTCVLSPPQYNNNLCATVDANNVCTSCLYSTTVLNAFNICVNVNPLCLTFDTNGNCLSCYSGYKLNNKTCTSASQAAQDNYCAIWNGSICMACAPWSYFDSNHICQLVSSACRTYDASNGHCTSCYVGWALNNGTCSYYQAADLNCQTFINNVCTVCYGGYFYNTTSGACEVANALCRTIDNNNKCLTCYVGYTLSGGNCTISSSNCQNSNSDGTCSKCVQGYHLNQNQLCISNSYNCLNYSSAQQICITCAYYFKEIGGACYPILFNNNTNITNNTNTNTTNNTNISSNTTYQDVNCALWSSNGSVCLSCMTRAFYSSLGKCQKVSDFCKTFSTLNGQCLTCYTGYVISGTTCILGSNNCLSSDIYGRCLSCYFSYYLSNSNCYPIDSLCATFNYTSLQCAKCYGGYKLVNKICQIAN